MIRSSLSVVSQVPLLAAAMMRLRWSGMPLILKAHGSSRGRMRSSSSRGSRKVEVEKSRHPSLVFGSGNTASRTMVYVESSDGVNEDGDAGPCSALGSMQGGVEVLSGEVGATAVDAAALRPAGGLGEVRHKPSSHEPVEALGDDATQGDFAEVCTGLRGAGGFGEGGEHTSFPQDGLVHRQHALEHEWVHEDSELVRQGCERVGRDGVDAGGLPPLGLTACSDDLGQGGEEVGVRCDRGVRVWLGGGEQVDGRGGSAAVDVGEVASPSVPSFDRCARRRAVLESRRCRSGRFSSSEGFGELWLVERPAVVAGGSICAFCLQATDVDGLVNVGVRIVDHGPWLDLFRRS